MFRLCITLFVASTLMLTSQIYMHDPTTDWQTLMVVSLPLAMLATLGILLFLRSNRRLIKAYTRKPGLKLLMRTFVGGPRKKPHDKKGATQAP